MLFVAPLAMQKAQKWINLSQPDKTPSKTKDPNLETDFSSVV
jgi:hypothetical protein